MHIAILGNSGSGKSTLAKHLAEGYGASVLDLDTVAWEPGSVAVSRDRQVAERDVASFCAGRFRWVVEGCYAGLIRAALPFEPRLLFLDPGLEQCLANCRARPWEPHKYESKSEQDERLQYLLAWVAEYYSRDGDMSHREHCALFEAYAGPKQHLTELPVGGAFLLSAEGADLADLAGAKVG